MKASGKFKIKATKFLNDSFYDTSFKFENHNEKKSQKQNIKVLKNDEQLFNIEAVLTNSKIKQFEVLKDDDKFIFSNKNNKNTNKYIKKIIKYLNKNFSQFKNGGNLSDKLSVIYKNQVVSQYLSEDKVYLIISNKSNSFYAAIPTENLDDFFDISAELRKNRSGTYPLPYKDSEFFEEALHEHLQNLNIQLEDFRFLDDDYKAVVLLNKKIQSHDDLYIENNKYYLSKMNDSSSNKYIVRKTINANTFNVIFSLEYTGPKSNYGLDNLKKYISSY